MKVCLVSNLLYNPFFRYFNIDAPLGLLILGAVVERMGDEVSIVDPSLFINKNKLDYGETFYAALVEHIIAKRPDILGLSAMCDSYHVQLRVGQAVKQKLPDVFICLGGAHASATAHSTLQAFPFVDAVVRGESESTFAGLLKALKDGRELSDIPGISYRTGNTIRDNPDAPPAIDLDNLPMPAFHLYPDIAAIKEEPPVEFGRSCPFQCYYCQTSLFWSRKPRSKSISRIIEELRLYSQMYGFKSIKFVDDLLPVDRRRVHELCTAIKQANLQLRWSCSSRIDTLDDDLMIQMAEAGCANIFFGVETGSQRMQKVIGKNLTIDKVHRVVGTAAQYFELVRVSFIVGFPEEEEADLDETLSLIVDLIQHPNVWAQVGPLIALPGTRVTETYAGRSEFVGEFLRNADARVVDSDLDLLRSHPQIFTSYWAIQHPRWSWQWLSGIDEFVAVACHFPASFKAMADRLGGGLALYHFWHAWRLELHDVSRIDASNFKSVVNHFRTYSYQMSKGHHLDLPLMGALEILRGGPRTQSSFARQAQRAADSVIQPNG